MEMGLHENGYMLDMESSCHSFASTSTVEEWLKTQPLAVLKLDPSDRLVLKIAG